MRRIKARPAARRSQALARNLPRSLDRVALEKRLAAAEAKLEPLLHASEKFERAERSPESEIRLQPYLDELFDVKPGELAAYEVGCRDVICKLDSDVTSVDWRMAIQSDLDAIGLFSVREVGESVYLWVPKDPVNAAGARFVIKIMVSLGMSAKVAACKTAHPTPGEVDFAFRFDRVTRRLSVIASGSLADQPGGQCIRKVLDEILATTPVPPDVTTVLEEPLSIRVP